MTDILQAAAHRRSIRAYTKEPISEENLKKILQTGLLSPSGRAIRPWEFIVVRSKETLQKLSKCRTAGSGILADADAAIVVLACTDRQDVWVEDCSIAMSLMHLCADSLGVGSCWIQGRLRTAADGSSTEDYLRSIFEFPEKYALEAILSLGMPGQTLPARSPEDADMSKVHWEEW